MRRILTAALLALLLPPLTAHALAPLSEDDRAEIWALTERAEQAIINKDLVALQSLCDPYRGLWVDAGYGLLIYYGWEQIPQMLENDWLYFIGSADGSGHPVYGRTSEIIWEGRWEVHDIPEPPDAVELRREPTVWNRVSLAAIMQSPDGRLLDGFTREPANMTFYWRDKSNFVQYFYAGEDRDLEMPYDNDFWFLVFDTRVERLQREWCLVGLAHLDGWGI